MLPLPPTTFLVGHRFNRRDGVLELRNPFHRTGGRHGVVLSSVHDEVALASLEAVQEGFELVHGAL